jgi:hypothetical protein
MQAFPKPSRRKPCPPHGPIVIDASEGGYFVASCLACGLVGPVREDVTKAKLAFDQKWH